MENEQQDMDVGVAHRQKTVSQRRARDKQSYKQSANSRAHVKVFSGSKRFLIFSRKLTVTDVPLCRIMPEHTKG